jgi:hypothetical protein
MYGRGHQAGCGNYDMGPLVEVCSSCARTIDVLNHRGYHTIGCPLATRPQSLFGPVADQPPGSQRRRGGRGKVAPANVPALATPLFEGMSHD